MYIYAENIAIEKKIIYTYNIYLNICSDKSYENVVLFSRDK